jgi:ribulose-5-phosphate 4-epimerase/fuculose-1-phosphate aldolase
MIDPIEAIKEKMIMVCKILQKQRVIDGYGHVTVRLSNERILSTPHMPPGKVAVRDLIIIDGEGNKLEGAGEPNGETSMHTSIYKARPDVQSILHYHADELIAVAASGQGIKVLSNAGVHFYRGTPIYDSPLLIRNHQLGDKVAATLGDRSPYYCAAMAVPWSQKISISWCGAGWTWCAQRGSRSWRLLSAHSKPTAMTNASR